EVLPDHASADHSPAIPHQKLQDRKLTRRQFNDLAGTLDRLSPWIKLQISHSQGRDLGARFATAERAEAGEKFLEHERLAEALVRSQVKAADPVLRAIRCQREDLRHPLCSLPAPEDGTAVKSGSCQIEDNHIVSRLVELPVPCLANVPELHGEP